MTITRIAGATLLLTAAALLTACGSGSPSPAGSTDAGATSPAATAASSTPTSPAATEVPDPSTTPAASFDATCASIVPADVQAQLDDAGLKPVTPGVMFEQPDMPLSRFTEYGGVLCEQASTSGELLVYGYGPLTPTQAAAEKKALLPLSDEHGTNKNGGTYYEVPPFEGGGQMYQVYVLSPAGYWAYTSGDYLDIQLLVPALPAFY